MTKLKPCPECQRLIKVLQAIADYALERDFDIYCAQIESLTRRAIAAWNKRAE